MSNPFEDPTGKYLVLQNSEGQYSLWPEPIAVPAGWRKVHGPGLRSEVLQYIDDVWDDMRPASLKAAMEQGGMQSGDSV